MLDAGVDIQRSLAVSAKQCKDAKLAHALNRCNQEVGNGQSLMHAIAQEKVFPPIMSELTAAGERTGHLNVVFSELAVFFELKTSLWRDFRAKITLPVLQYIAAVFIISLASYIYNSITDQPTSGVVWLPVLGYGLPAGTVLSIWAIRKYFNGCRVIDEIFWHIPGVASVVRSLAISRFSLSLKFAMQSGMHVKEAMQLAFDVSGNSAFKAEAPNVIDTVSNGESITSAFENINRFDEEYLAVISIAEETGKMTEKLDWLAGHYKEKTQTALTVISSLAAKLIWVAVSGFILFFIFRIFSAYVGQISQLTS